MYATHMSSYITWQHACCLFPCKISDTETWRLGWLDDDQEQELMFSLGQCEVPLICNTDRKFFTCPWKVDLKRQWFISFESDSGRFPRRRFVKYD